MQEPATANRDLFTRHLPSLDGIRGLAILFVILHHSQAFSWKDSPVVGKAYRQWVQAGWIGVDLFFVLSGFLITGILLKTVGRPGWLKNFFARRALRVLPLYYVTILVCLVILPLVPLASLDWLRALSDSQGWYWLHLSNFRRIASIVDPTLPPVYWMSTFWSLAIEEHFYIVWPFVVLLCSRRGWLLWVCLGGAALSFALRLGLAADGVQGQFIYYNTFTRLDGLLLGSGVATWLYKGGSLERLKRPAVVVATLSVAAFLVPLFMGIEQSGRDTTVYGKSALYSFAALFSAGVLIHALRPASNSVLTRFLRSDLLRAVGKYSYAMYVFNKPVLAGVAAMMAFSGVEAGSGVAFAGAVLAALLTFGAAWLSWRLIEAPFLTLKRFFVTKPAELNVTPRVDQLSGAWQINE